MTLFESAALGLVLAALLVKPSELPPLARRLGRSAGRAVNRFQSMKREMGEYVEKNELRSVHDELEQTLGQLSKIRQDVRSVSSVRGMMTEFASGSGRDRRDTAGLVDEDGRDAARVGAAGMAPATTPYTVLPISAGDVRRARAAETAEAAGTPGGSTKATGYTGDTSIRIGGDEVTGSGILRATLEEERVAKAAAQFLTSGTGAPVTDANKRRPQGMHPIPVFNR